MHPLIKIAQIDSNSLSTVIREPFYHILIFDGPFAFTVDFTRYECSGQNLLFLSPYQLLQWERSSSVPLTALRFHGDFYCIEYHKREVACNGILFNNIYQQPFVPVQEGTYRDISEIVRKMNQHLSDLDGPYDLSIISTYLQLILALSSKEKQLQMNSGLVEEAGFDHITHFQSLLEDHFRESKKVAFYAGKSGLAVNTFSKKIRKHFGKSPTKLIQERIVLEAKKLLHLTYKPVKEIAAELHFEDEFYFSRYFKKEVGVSPTHFRDRVGISIVAK